ncbi:MAG: hypothetical protein HY299_18465 [Verrucomicrobia bacterium]|nr:hypothetical protein [Verrucomicrobiota bacterium]
MNSPNPLCVGLIALLLAGCRTASLLPPTNLSDSGWQTRQGQAVWRPTRRRVEIAGELLYATNANGKCFVQFSKPPFDLVTAQIMDGQWQIEFGNGQHHWSGRGNPPSRFVWFKIAWEHADTMSKGPWQYSQKGSDSWRWENPSTGEFLEGAFFR